jgi:hypothetical protein
MKKTPAFEEVVGGKSRGQMKKHPYYGPCHPQSQAKTRQKSSPRSLFPRHPSVGHGRARPRNRAGRLRPTKLFQFLFGADEPHGAVVEQDQATARVVIIEGEQLGSAVPVPTHLRLEEQYRIGR